MKPTAHPFFKPRPFRRSLPGTAAALGVALAGWCGSTVQGATVYFDPTGATTLGGSGTFTAQTTALYSPSAAGGGTLVAAAATDDGVFQGTAGTVTFSTAYALNSATFNVSGYVLTPGSTAARVFTSPLLLAAGVNLNLLDVAQTADRTLGIGSVTGGSGSTLTIQGAQTGTASARINLAVVSATVSVPTTITGPGTSLAGFVATSTGVQITNTVSNSTGFTTLLGATNGNDLTLGSAAVVSGSAGVQFSAGSSGGAGLVTINSANTYTGATTLNNSAAGVIRLGVNNALPATTALQFGVGANATGSLDLNGHSQTVGSLAVTGTSTVNGIVNTSASAAALTVNGSATTTYGSVIGVPANVTNLAGANNNLSLTLAATNTGNLTLSGANTYTGATTINGGTLTLANPTAPALSAATAVSINTTGTLALGAANQLTATTPVQLSGVAGTGKAATLNVGGFNQGSATAAGIGMLTLAAGSANDVINFGGTAAVVSFAGLTTNNATLTISGYLNNNGASGGSDRLIFGQDETANLGNIVFTGYGATTETALGGGFYEVFPAAAAVPEPSGVLFCLLLTGAAVFVWNRRRVSGRC